MSCEMAARRGDYIFSVLGKLPVVPIGDTGTIPFAKRQHAEARHLTPERDGEAAADGGTSIRGP
jgi:hypothetical protein